MPCARTSSGSWRPIRLACLAILLPICAAAQLRVALLEGRVVDSQQRPLAAATVHLLDPQGEGVSRTTTAADGTFTIADVAPGAYLLQVERAGQVVLSRTLTIRGSLPIVLTLQVNPGVREEVVVRGDAGEATVVRPWSLAGEAVREIASALPSQRLQDTIASLPGWSAEDNGLLHVRGVDDGLLYVVDGVPVYERIDRLFGLAPNPASVASLSVINGYIPPEYGYKSGGVIQIRSVSGVGQGWSGSVDAGAGAHAATHVQGLAAGPAGPIGGLMISGSDERSSRFLDPVHPGNFHNDGRATTLGLQGTRQTSSHLFTTSFQAGRSLYDVPHNEEQEEEGQDQRQRVRQLMLSGSWQHAASDRTVWQISAYQRGARADLRSSPFDTPISSAGARRNLRSGALWSVTHQRGTHVIKAGAETSWMWLDETFMFAVTESDEAEEAGLSDEALTHDLANPFRVSAAARPTLFSAFAQDTWHASAEVTIDYGVRLDRSRLLDRASQVSPRLGVAYQVRPGTIVRASVLRLFQPPQVEYLLLASSDEARALSPFVDETTIGGAPLPPERQTAVETSISHELSGHLRLDAGGWLRRGQDVDDPNVFYGTTVTFPNSVARQHAQGLDVRLDLLPLGGFAGSATYSYGRVVQFGPINGGLFLEDEFIEIGEGTEFTPDHDLRHAFTVKATYANADQPWRVSGAIRYRSGTPIEVDEDDLDELRDRPGAEVVDFEAGRVRPRLVADLQAQWDAFRSQRTTATLVLWLENVTDKLYAYNFGNPFSGTHFGAPRRAGFAVRIAFDR